MSVARGGPNAGHFYCNIVQPIKIALAFTVDPSNSNGLGVSSLKSNGWVRNVFMHTSATPGSNDGYLNPNPASGYAYIQLKQNFNKYLDLNWSVEAPVTGSAINISGSGVLTRGIPYVIQSVGQVPAPSFTITTVADVSGSLASKYLLVSDSFSNNYVLWFQVSGVGAPPALVGNLSNYVAVPVSIATNAANTAVATALGTVVAALNNSNSFTQVTSTNVVTVTSKVVVQLSPRPADFNTGFTVSAVTFTSLQSDWQSVGLQPGLVPAVNQSFIATATGSALGSGTVKASGISGIGSIEVVGDPNQSIGNQNIAAFGGAWLTLQLLAPTSSSVTTPVPTAPTALSVLQLELDFDQSQVSVDGL